MKSDSFFAELKRRNVSQVAVADQPYNVAESKID
jgi:hypothetical protein